jgi:hypothetical protein
MVALAQSDNRNLPIHLTAPQAGDFAQVHVKPINSLLGVSSSRLETPSSKNSGTSDTGAAIFRYSMADRERGEHLPRDPALLKIVIVGTPKTGNTWVKHLLADIYGLPIVRLGTQFSPGEVASAGPRWIAHQHFLPTQNLVDWGLDNNVVFLSAVRHPGDVLVSLWHHVRNQRLPREADTADCSQGASMLLDGPAVMGEHTRRFVEEGFHLYVNLSVAWMRRSLTSVVRYESLWDCPLETLRSLTSDIIPVSDDRLSLAISACELAMMQSVLDPEKKFIRQGGVGAWRTALPEEIKHLLATLDPYPQQFAALGYTMDESDPANTPRPIAASVPSPFGTDKAFANGVPITPVLMKAYFEQPSTLRSRWPDPRVTTHDSFFAWLNLPAAADPHMGHVGPAITELAYYIYTLRSDVRAAFPEIFRADRVAFTEWFLFDARKEYGLDRTFTSANPFSEDNRFDDGTPVTRVLVRAWLDLPETFRRRWPDPTRTAGDSFLAWLNSAAGADPFAGKIAPVITELGAHLHSIRTDVASAMPDLYSQHRVNFTNWFLSSARKEYKFDRALTLPVIRSWAELADEVPAHVCQLRRSA